MVGNPTSNTPDLKEHFINANRTIAQSEETSINEYVARRKWDMQKLPEGVRLWEYEKGRGPKVNVEDSVHIVYNVEAINGKLIYSDITDDYVAGRRQQMIGLDQAVLQLSVGSRAKVILPSNLAYGIGGDGDRIPQSAILVIDVKVN
jgi:FKBP-type peptidyl-prolyl cis-trans isomerase